MGSKGEAARRDLLLEWVLTSRKNLSKLLALLRWSRNAHLIQRLQNVVAFLQHQSFSFRIASDNLWELFKYLRKIRQENYDLISAGRLLSGVTVEEEKHGNSRQLDDYMRYIVARSRERLVDLLTHYHVKDGKLYIKLDGAYSIVLQMNLKDKAWTLIRLQLLFGFTSVSTYYHLHGLLFRRMMLVKEDGNKKDEQFSDKLLAALASLSTSSIIL
jgi:hypothetical protein